MNTRIAIALLLGVVINKDATAGETTAINLNAGVVGIVQRINVKAGDLVKKDQLLLELDGQARLAEVELAKAKIQVATAMLDLSEATWKRANQLIKQNAISKEEFDKITLERAKAKADLAETKAKLAIAQATLELTQVRAPVDGKVALVQVNVGQYVQVGATLVRLETTAAAPLQDTDKVKALLKERRDVLARAVALQMDRVKQGALSIREILPLERALLEASLELAETPPERVKLLRAHMSFHEETVRLTKLRLEAGAGIETDVLVAQAELLSVRIRLAREEDALKK